MLGGQLVHRAGVWPPSARRQRVAELVDAADYSPDRSGGVRPPTSRRITGSRQRRSASLTSSHPARREKTDWRRNPAGRWRPFRPVRGSASDSAAMFVSPRASSSSRWNSRPPSELMEDPRKTSFTEQSNWSPAQLRDNLLLLNGWRALALAPTMHCRWRNTDNVGQINILETT